MFFFKQVPLHLPLVRQTDNSYSKTHQCFYEPVCYLVNEKQLDQCSLIHEGMTLMNQLFLVNQKHAAQPVLSVSGKITLMKQLFLVNQNYTV